MSKTELTLEEKQILYDKKFKYLARHLKDKSIYSLLKRIRILPVGSERYSKIWFDEFRTKITFNSNKKYKYEFNSLDIDAYVSDIYYGSNIKNIMDMSIGMSIYWGEGGGYVMFLGEDGYWRNYYWDSDEDKWKRCSPLYLKMFTLKSIEKLIEKGEGRWYRNNLGLDYWKIEDARFRFDKYPILDIEVFRDIEPVFKLLKGKDINDKP